jgi:uncharacterized membrane protein YcaP (DUF421 family)
MNGGDNSLTGGLILASTLILLSTLIAYGSYRSKGFQRVIQGTPTLLIHKGRILHSHLHKERLSETDLHMLLRKHGVHKAEELSSAVLEPDGSLSIIKS